MKKITWYIAKQTIVGFCVVCFSLMSVLWLTQSLRFVELITNKGISMSIFAELTTLLMPRIFVVLAPLSVFAAVMFTYNRMLSDRELVVIKSAGISSWQIVKPALLVGFVLSFVCLFVYNITIPWAEVKFRELQWKVEHDVSHLMFREGEFVSLQPRLMVFIASHEKDGAVKGVLVNDERKPTKKVTLSAELGRVIYTDKGPKVLLVNGSRQELDLDTKQFSSLFFERHSMDFGEGFEKNKRTRISPREKSLYELLTASNDKTLSKTDINKYLVEGNKRLFAAFYNILFALLGCLGLVLGNFNRRGQIKTISISIFAMVFVLALDLMLQNMAAKHIFLLPVLYANLLLPMSFCLFLLFFYTPGMFQKLRRSVHEK